MTIQTIDDAFDFIQRFGNVARDKTQLIETTPTVSQLENARDRCYAEVDRAFRLVSQFHGIALDPEQCPDCPADGCNDSRPCDDPHPATL